MINRQVFQSYTEGNYRAYLDSVPYDVTRRSLYTGAELFDAFDPDDPTSQERCLDSRVYRHMLATGKVTTETGEMMARHLHDFHILQLALQMLHRHNEHKVVGVMGGHALLRTDAYYRRVVEVGKALTERGYLMLSGGGPGAMEATHVGAWLAGRPAADVDAALVLLGQAVNFEAPGWLATSLECMRRFPQEQGYESLSIPTWYYGHEPPAPFATHIAKLFINSIREDTLLTEAYGGLIFMPGGAGTLQEIFQECVQNHYVTLGYPSPMIFVGREFWTETIPAYAFIRQLMDKGRYQNLEVSLVETTGEILAALCPLR